MTMMLTSVQTELKTFTFDEAQAQASVGDKIRCVKAVTGMSFFTEGKEYEFITGTQFYTAGVTTIRDDGGVETPPDYVVPGRIPLLDTFVFVEDAPKVVDEPTVFVEQELPLPKERMLELANAGLYAMIDDNNKAMFKLREAISEADKVDDSGVKPWKELTDSEKGALMVAHLDGKNIQFHGFWTWGDEFITLNKSSTPEWNDDTLYRVEPAFVQGLREELQELQQKNNSLYGELNLLNGDEDEELDEWDW